MDLTSYIAAAPEMVLLGLICVVLVADLFVKDDRRVITYWMTLATLGATLWALFATAPESRTLVFSGAYVSDPLSQVMLAGPLIVLYVLGVTFAWLVLRNRAKREATEDEMSVALSMFRQGDEVEASTPSSVLAGAGIGWVVIVCDEALRARRLKPEWAWDQSFQATKDHPVSALTRQLILYNPWR